MSHQFPHMTELSKEPGCILLVEDAEGFAHLVKRLLNRKGYQVECVATGAQAMAWLENNRPHLILLDFYLPDMTGRHIVEYLHNQDKDIPFIIMTGSDDKRLAIEMMNQGAVEFLVKDTAFIGLLPGLVKKTVDYPKADTRRPLYRLSLLSICG